MILKNIEILNFKNIESANLEFSPGVNCLLGGNGMGKSNLLDAIHYLGMVRPMNQVNDSALIKHDTENMIVKGCFLTEGEGEDIISCGITKGKGKKIKRNGKEYSRLSEHIGRYPVVTVTPGDTRLLGGAEERRRLLDIVISQADASYLQQLIRYTRALESRNKMLRAGVRDNILYESIETSMADAARSVWQRRKDWIENISDKVEQTYSRLSGRRETIGITYKSQLNTQDLPDLLKERKLKDQALGFTSAGPHRDDIDIILDGYPLRTVGSQGQSKTFTVALKLAIYDFLRNSKNTAPLLLLDDIFDKLDSSRVENIMNEVSSSGEFRQIFITDTNRSHLDEIINVLPGESVMFNVEQGNFSPINI